MRVDAVTLEVARNRFAAIADEMGVVLRRTAYSPNIKERADCSAAIFVPSGEMLAQAEHIPVHLGSMPTSVAAVIGLLGEAVAPGVQFAVNDPFHGGTHLNDLTLVRPVLRDGRLVGWVANRAHHADVGGEAPGSMPAHATRLEQEGCIVSPMVAAVDGEWVPEFLDRFLAATRTPDERIGDLSAQLGSNEAGSARLLEVIEAEGVGRHELVTQSLLDYGESRMRAAIEALPAAFVGAQLRQVADYFLLGAAKSGMLYARDIICEVADFFAARRGLPLVVDPVMVATSGALLLREDAVAALRARLL
ncbi:MAG: hydantoinase B/oxoprolinase family protein, partial [Actinomycetota bacterium]